MHRIGQRHHCGSGLGYRSGTGITSSVPLTSSYGRHRPKNECFCLIF